MLYAGWNVAARARVHNERDRGIRNGRTTGGQVRKADFTWCGIRMTSLNISMGREGGMETALQAL